MTEPPSSWDALLDGAQPFSGALQRRAPSAAEGNESDWYLQDDEGNAVEPAAEGSALMEAYVAFCERSGSGVASDEEGFRGIAVPDETMQQLKKLRDGDESEVAQDAVPPSHAKVSQNQVDSGGSDEEGLEEEEEVGMCSRSYSDGSMDDWVLEYLLKRRPLKHPAQPQHHGSFCDDDGQPLPLDTHEYLCKWKWYAEPTWEARSVLEELGLGTRLEEFDASRVSISAQHRKHPSPGEARVRVAAGSVERFIGTEVIMNDVLKKFDAAGLSLLRYAPVLNTALERRFVSRWCNGLGDLVPHVLFHGTRLVNVRSIAQTGFKIPGRAGVKVLSGSAHGRGVYTAPTPRLPVSFCSSDLMFVCLGLVAPNCSSGRVGDADAVRQLNALSRSVKAFSSMTVFFDESLVIPLWVVQFRRRDAEALDDVERAIIHREVPPQQVALSPLIGGAYGRIDYWQSARANAHPNIAPLNKKDTVIVAGGTHHRSFTKKMIRQLPRSVKDAYMSGELRARKTS